MFLRLWSEISLFHKLIYDIAPRSILIGWDIAQQTFDVSATLEWRLTLTLDWRCRKVVIGSFLDVGFGRDQSDQNPTWFQRLYNVVCLLGYLS